MYKVHAQDQGPVKVINFKVPKPFAFTLAGDPGDVDAIPENGSKSRNSNLKNSPYLLA